MLRSLGPVLALLVVAIALAIWLLGGASGTGSGATDAVGPSQGADSADAAPPTRGEDERRPPGLDGRVGASEHGDEPVGGTVAVHVVDAAGGDLPGAVLRLLVGHDEVEGITGPDGRVTFENVPYDGSAIVVLSPGRGAWGVPSAVVTGPDLRLVAAMILPLRVDVVDAETGLFLPAATWDSETLGLEGGGPHPSGEPVRVALSGHSEIRGGIRVDPPPGYVTAGGSSTWIASIYARELRLVVPVRREVTLRVAVTDAEGHAVPDARIVGFRVNELVHGLPNTGPYLLGSVALRGVPHYPGEVLEVLVRTSDDLDGIGRVTLPIESHAEVELEVPVPSDLEPVDYGSLEDEELVPSGDETAVPPTGPTGGVVLEVLRSDGTPAQGARIEGPWRTPLSADTAGRVHTPAVRAGSHRVVVREPGLVPFESVVHVAADQTTHAVLREPEGATVNLRVTREGGAPLPFASLTVLQSQGTLLRYQRWIDLDGDVQHLAVWTDSEGRRVLRRIAAGTVLIEAAWAGRWTRTKIELRDRETRDVELVLR